MLQPRLAHNLFHLANCLDDVGLHQHADMLDYMLIKLAFDGMEESIQHASGLTPNEMERISTNLNRVGVNAVKQLQSKMPIQEVKLSHNVRGLTIEFTIELMDSQMTDEYMQSMKQLATMLNDESQMAAIMSSIGLNVISLSAADVYGPWQILTQPIGFAEKLNAHIQNQRAKAQQQPQ